MNQHPTLYFLDITWKNDQERISINCMEDAFLRSLCNDKEMTEISKKLGLEYDTTRKYGAALCEKFGVKTLPGLAVKFDRAYKDRIPARKESRSRDTAA